MVVYLDDGIAAVTGAKQAQAVSLHIRQDLNNAGFVTNTAKCKWEPSQQCSWLGFDIDIAVGKVTVPQQKIDSLSDHICCK